MVARPFSVGQRIRIRSGAFGGIFDAEVRGMGLTHVELMTDDGPLKLPNLGMLAAAVGPAPEPVKDPDAKTLYVDRSLDKRPPRVAPPHGSRRQHRDPERCAGPATSSCARGSAATRAAATPPRAPANRALRKDPRTVRSVRRDSCHSDRRCRRRTRDRCGPASWTT